MHPKPDIDSILDAILTPEELAEAGATRDQVPSVRLRRLCAAYQSVCAGNLRLHQLNNQLEKKQMPIVEGSFPVVVYFATKADAEEFTTVVQAAHPNLTPKDL